MGTIREEIAKNIRFYRKKSGLTQKELSEKIGVNNSAVSNWESGQNSIDIEILVKVCDALGVSLSDIYGIYGNTTTEEYSSHEREVILAYRSNPSMQEAVDKLLGVSPEAPSIGEDIASTVAAAVEKSSVKS